MKTTDASDKGTVDFNEKTKKVNGSVRKKIKPVKIIQNTSSLRKNQ